MEIILILNFTENVYFTIPSAAANTIAGRSSNGRTEWKVMDTNQTYREWQELEIQKAEDDINISTNQLELF